MPLIVVVPYTAREPAASVQGESGDRNSLTAWAAWAGVGGSLGSGSPQLLLTPARAREDGGEWEYLLLKLVPQIG